MNKKVARIIRWNLTEFAVETVKPVNKYIPFICIDPVIV